MKTILYLTVLSLFLFISCGGDDTVEEDKFEPAFPVIGEKYDIGAITSEEAYALELINRARSNPNKEALFLINSGDREINGGISYFKVDTDRVISDFATYEIKMPLAFNKKLMSVSDFVAQMLIEYDIQDHTPDKKPFVDRFNNAGYPYSGAGENIFAYSKNVLHSHGAFNIDWGYGAGGVQDALGHRKTIMGVGSASGYREIGIRVENTIPSGKKVGPQIVTHDVGSRRNNSDYFITGVIYDDKNANNFYDIGEGLAGITVSADNGRYHCITGESGSYTLPFLVGDNITKVQAYGKEFALQVADVTLKSASYKLDFNVQKTAANGDASIGFDFLNNKKTIKMFTVPEKEYAPLSLKK